MQKNQLVSSIVAARNLFDPMKLLIPAPAAGAAIGYAVQTTRNLIWAGKFPLPVTKVGRKSMVKVADLLKFVENLQPVEQKKKNEKKKMGRPTKAVQMAKADNALAGEGS